LPPRPTVVLQSLLQLGPEPLALNALYRFGLWTGHYERSERRGFESRPLLSTLHSLFLLPQQKELVRTLGKDGKAALFKEADEIVKGKVRLFGGEPVPLQLAFSQTLYHWTAYEKNPQLFAPLFSLVSDIKFLWEPARFGWAFTLGRAYCVARPRRSISEEYAETFWKYFEQFAEGNPPYLGPHWMNGQEVAIRLTALVWAAQVFEGATASNANRCETTDPIYCGARQPHPADIGLCNVRRITTI